jgi:3-phosphoglycerate kinase
LLNSKAYKVELLLNSPLKKNGSITDITTIRFSGADIPEVPSSEAAAIVIKTYKAQEKKYTPEQEEATKQAIQVMIDEAIRVTKSMPKWEPAYRDKEKKQPCRTKFCLPFVFRLA